jgi:4-hydroxybenzoate polyprenyltransferase
LKYIGVGHLIKLSDFLVNTSIFTAFCALGLCVATEKLIGVPFAILHSSLHLAVIGGTLVVYNLPRLFPTTKPGSITAGSYRFWQHIFLAVGVLLTGYSLTGLSEPSIIAGSCAGILALGYTMPALRWQNKKRLRDYGILKILVLTGVWTVVTAIIPILEHGNTITKYPFEILMRFVFVFVLCILFDIRDIQKDVDNKLITLPTRIGIQKSYSLINLSLIVFLLLSIVQHYRFAVPGRLIAAIVTTVITYWVAKHLRYEGNKRLFVIITDGMMILYAVLVILLY